MRIRLPLLLLPMLLLLLLGLTAVARSVSSSAHSSSPWLTSRQFSTNRPYLRARYQSIHRYGIRFRSSRKRIPARFTAFRARFGRQKHQYSHLIKGQVRRIMMNYQRSLQVQVKRRIMQFLLKAQQLVTNEMRRQVNQRTMHSCCKERYHYRVFRQEIRQLANHLRRIHQTKYHTTIRSIQRSTRSARRKQQRKKRNVKRRQSSQHNHTRSTRRRSGPLRSRKTVGQRSRRFTYMRRRIDRYIHRALIFLYRKGQLHRRTKLLAQRIARLTRRRKALKERIARLKLTRHRWKLLRRRSSTAASSRARRIDSRISRITRIINILDSRRHHVRRRIGRAAARRRRIRYRIGLLNRRIQRQLRGSRRVIVRASRILVRWRANRNPSALINNLGRSDPKVHQQRASLLLDRKKLTRAKIRYFMRTMVREHRKDDLYFKQALVLRRRLARVKRRMSSLQTQIAQYVKRLHLEKGRNTSQAKRHSQSLRVVIENKRKKYKHLKTRLAILKARRDKVQQNFARNFYTWTTYVKKSGLPEFMQVFKDKAYGETVKMKRKVMKRRKMENTNVKIAREVRLRRQRFTRRVVKRMTRIQQRLQRTARKAVRLRRQRLHIARLRVQLRRRIRRIQARRPMLKRRIGAVAVRVKRLVRRRKHLKASLLAVGRSAAGKSKGKQRGASKPFSSRHNRIQAQIKRMDNRIASLKSHMNRLKRRRLRMKHRMWSISWRIRRLGLRRFVVRRRISRILKRLAMLREQKKRFTRRMSRNKLVSHRLVRRISKPIE